jgi:outer membrane lipoprotein carrier protein
VASKIDALDAAPSRLPDSGSDGSNDGSPIEAGLDAVGARAADAAPETPRPPDGGSAPDAGDRRLEDARAAVQVDAATTPDADPGDPEGRRIAALVQKSYRDARSFEADFEQTYRNRLLGQTKESSGHVWLRPPDRMRWEYAPPTKNLVVADGRHLFVFEPEANQVLRMPVAGSELPSVMAFLTGGRNLEEDYSLEAVHGEQLAARGQSGLELRPRRPSSVIARVVLVVARETGQVQRTVLVDPEGNTNTFAWSSVRTDRELPDARFSFTPPQGARVVER